MLERKLAPPNAYLKELNPRRECIYPDSLLLPQETYRLDPVPFESRRIQVPLEQTPFPNDRAERVSVNSFGIGGANAHVRCKLMKIVRCVLKLNPLGHHGIIIILYQEARTSSK